MHEPFSVARMKGSLVLFGAGKVLSALVGIAWLLLLVRVLDVKSYGGYITLLALLEVTSLLSNAGVYAFAQRYLTEARLSHNLAHLPGLLWGSLIFRLSTLLVVVIAFGYLNSEVAGWLQQDHLVEILPIYGFVVLFEGAARYLELVFESLLEQAKAQAGVVLRNLSRVLLVWAWWFYTGTVTLRDVVIVELCTGIVGFLSALYFSWVITGIGRSSSELRDASSAEFGLGRFASFCLPMYAAQCLVLIYSPDTIKIIVSRLLGAVEAAAFGFAHAVSFVMQRYLPANLLLGLIRPMLVARRAHGNNDEQLVLVGNLILKINIFLLLPVVAFLALCGDDVSSLLSGGKFKGSGELIFLLTFLLVPMGLHVVMSMLATAVEDRRAVLLGTFASTPGVFIGVLLSRDMGSLAMALGLWVSELSWCFFTHHLLRRSGFHFQVDWLAWLKFFAAAIAAALIAYSVLGRGDFGLYFRLLVAVLVIFPIYLLTAFFLKPFSLAESKLFSRLMPARFGKLFVRP